MAWEGILPQPQLRPALTDWRLGSVFFFFVCVCSTSLLKPFKQWLFCFGEPCGLVVDVVFVVGGGAAATPAAASDGGGGGGGGEHKIGRGSCLGFHLGIILCFCREN